ncbi:MAG: lipoate--protein ligase family protein [Planctomycetota bacterium]
MPTRLALIIDPPGDGAWNMAVDEALLDWAIEHGEAILRFYRWREPTVSLGYFQKHADRQRHPASAALPCVRRHSGGGALIHDHELTYSLALPAAALPDGGAESCYRRVHAAVVSVLENALPGAELKLCDSAIVRPPADEPFLCFQRRSEGDLLAVSAGAEHKVMGSAQRKRRGAVLQHGGLLLAQSASAPELPGLAELFGGDISERTADLVAPLAEAMAGCLDAELAEATLGREMLRKAERELAGRFGNVAWSKRR